MITAMRQSVCLLSDRCYDILFLVDDVDARFFFFFLIKRNKRKDPSVGIGVGDNAIIPSERRRADDRGMLSSAPLIRVVLDSAEPRIHPLLRLSRNNSS